MMYSLSVLYPVHLRTKQTNKNTNNGTKVMINMSYDKELDSDKEESIYPEGYDCYTHQSHKIRSTRLTIIVTRTTI